MQEINSLFSEAELAFAHWRTSFSPDLGIAEVIPLEFVVRFRCGCSRRVGSQGQIYQAYFCNEHDEKTLTEHMDGL